MDCRPYAPDQDLEKAGENSSLLSSLAYKTSSKTLRFSAHHNLIDKFRTPDTRWRKYVRFGPRSGSRGTSRGGAALDRRVGEGKPDAPRRAHFEAHPQARAGEDGRRFIEDLTERVGGVRAVRRAEWSQGDSELAV